MAKQRLDKLLAGQGFGSRSQVGRMIRCGDVQVDGVTVKSPSISCDPEKETIIVAGERLFYKPFVTLMMNKPAGILSASRDNRAKTVVDLVPDALRRRDLFPAGRLDKDTTGLLILTDDGQMAHRMLSPKKGIEKVYHVQVEGTVGKEQQDRFKQGITLADGTVCLPARMDVLEEGEKPLLRVVIMEGKYHQIKRMLGMLERPVLSLKRVSIGGLLLDDSLSEGQCRELTDEEVKAIWQRSPYPIGED